ncbi:Uncharacterized protein OBRU01_20283 [Operophtera brumata]|uniref:Uncharacterized protein n=1 Tax=Operophtera brumata TaxID=104452 RepID=A0A0L7KW53_OPEBR|nr:Uncharacterized protein OBRU01_20283 [Operophtera brumata]
MLKFSGSIIWRLSTRGSFRKYSSSGATVVMKDKIDLTRNISDTIPKINVEAKDSPGLVAAAFASLNSPESDGRTPSPKSAKQTRTQQIDNQILKASDVNSLLVVAEMPVVSRRHALKVMKALNQKGRRSTPLLRALSHNITRQSDVIDLKRSADLLFSMASLNFPDPVLLDRICNDVIECLPSNKDKPAVVNSIIVSLGLMKYRHEPALSAITTWLLTHRSVYL